MFYSLTPGQNVWCIFPLKPLDQEDDEMKLGLTLGKE